MARREAEQKDADPLVVEFCGEDFTCRSAMNHWVFLEMMAANHEEQGEVAAAYMAFLEEMIVPEDWQRFRKACRSNRVSASDLQPLTTAVSEFYAGNPTQPSSASSDTSPATTSTLKAVSSSKAAAGRAS